MNRIILIGNGFDLAHGLPTSYRNFMEAYLDELRRELLFSFTRIVSDKLCKFSLKTPISSTWYNFFYGKVDRLKISFEELVQMLAENPELFEIKFTPFMEKIKQSYKTRGWVDIESEFYSLLCSFTSLKYHPYDSPAALNGELAYLQCLLAIYLEVVQEQLVSEGILLPGIQELISEPIKDSDISVESRLKGFYGHFPERILGLNFNYTQTADMYLRKVRKGRTIHIHGELSEPWHMIFGYGDELDDEYPKLLKRNDNELLRNMKSIRYLETDNYRKMLDFIESASYQVYVMGHSCGNSDRTLLNRLFEHRNCASIKLFYYRSGNGEDNYLDIVQNICRNFTDMNLFRDRVVNRMFCRPLPQAPSKSPEELQEVQSRLWQAFAAKVNECKKKGSNLISPP